MNDISIHKGENKSRKLTVFLDKTEYILKAEEYYLFEMYDGDCLNKDPVLIKKLEDNKLQFVKADTINLKRKSYPYLIKLILPNDEFIVVIDKSFVTIE